MRYLANVVSLHYNSEKCTGCRRCTEVCARGVFIMDGKRAAITDKDMCIECGACAKNCEYGAISVNAGVGCASAIIYGALTGKEPQCGCTPTDSGACC